MKNIVANWIQNIKKANHDKFNIHSLSFIRTIWSVTLISSKMKSCLISRNLVHFIARNRRRKSNIVICIRTCMKGYRIYCLLKITWNSRLSSTISSNTSSKTFMRTSLSIWMKYWIFRNRTKWTK